MALIVLKTHPQFFRDIASGAKKFEIRRNDRNFEEGDEIELHEFIQRKSIKEKPTYGTGIIRARISYVLKNYDGLDEHYCIFALDDVRVIQEGSLC